jgi:hypothetical protein
VLGWLAKLRAACGSSSSIYPLYIFVFISLDKFMISLFDPALSLFALLSS